MTYGINFPAEENFYVTPAKLPRSQEYPINEKPSTFGLSHLTPFCGRLKIMFSFPFHDTYYEFSS